MLFPLAYPGLPEPGTKILKCAEGLHNKAFLLTLDTGEEVFAKLPNPNAGPSRYLTASEVATREFVGFLVFSPVSYQILLVL